VSAADPSTDPNPFVRHRRMLESYADWMRDGRDDDGFVALVRALDDAVATVSGTRFVTTPLAPQPTLAQQVGADGIDLWVKDETGNVGGSHKGRHLFGLALHLAVAVGGDLDALRSGPDLAIASCGNAAIAAAIVARAIGRRLQVFIPVGADAAVVTTLESLGAAVTACPRDVEGSGDPAYAAFRSAVDAGAVAFSCQGTDAPATIDGGRTIAWEFAEQLGEALGAPARLDRVFVQVGGGALATAVGRGLVDAFRAGWLDHVASLHAVQTVGAFPLVRAWDLLGENIVEALGAEFPPITSGADRAAVAKVLREQRRSPVIDQWLAHASAEPDRYMWAWEDTPASVATGILDDVTYDWLGVVEPMIRTGGWPVIVDDRVLLDANRTARATTGVDVDVTGSAGLAGMIESVRRTGTPAYGERVLVLFTGVKRG
jgi:threonine synthase